MGGGGVDRAGWTGGREGVGIFWWWRCGRRRWGVGGEVGEDEREQVEDVEGLRENEDSAAGRDSSKKRHAHPLLHFRIGRYLEGLKPLDDLVDNATNLEQVAARVVVVPPGRLLCRPVAEDLGRGVQADRDGGRREFDDGRREEEEDHLRRRRKESGAEGEVTSKLASNISFRRL